MGKTGSGKQVPSVFMHRKRKHTGVIIEDVLDTIPMVGIKVDVGHSQTQRTQPGNENGNVIVHAEARGSVRHSVMQSTSEVYGVFSLSFENELPGPERTASQQRSGLVHPGKRGGVRAGKPVAVKA
jgi:hypothetical protein